MTTKINLRPPNKSLKLTLGNAQFKQTNGGHQERVKIEIMTTIDLREITGFRGEKIVELCLTDYSLFKKPLFRPGFLGDKWPAIDFYVELSAVRGKTPYFFGQVKATSADLPDDATALIISTKKKDIERLLRIPGPTYIFGVHEPTHRVFVQSVHQGTPKKAISKIPFTHELKGIKLQQLQDEVKDYWSKGILKPVSSVFS